MKSKRIVQYVVAGTLTLGMSLPAWALTEAEARIGIEQQAANQQLDTDDRTAAVEAMSTLVQKGMPVERAYELVEAAIAKGVRGPQFADFAKYVENRGNVDTTEGEPAVEAVSHFQRETAREMRDQARDYAEQRETLDVSGPAAAMGDREMGGSLGADANINAGGLDHAVSGDIGAGGGVGAGGGTGAGGDIGAGGGVGAGGYSQ